MERLVVQFCEMHDTIEKKVNAKEGKAMKIQDNISEIKEVRSRHDIHIFCYESKKKRNNIKHN